jgi:hypothetical protein
MAPGQYCTAQLELTSGHAGTSCLPHLLLGGGDWQDITSHSRPFDLLIFGEKKTLPTFTSMNCGSLVI